MVGIAGIIEKVYAEKIPTRYNCKEGKFEDEKCPNNLLFEYSELTDSFNLQLLQSHSSQKNSKNLALPYFETEDKQFVCGLIGGVYNRKELRDRLISLGYVFQGLQDAELIIYLYKQYGILNLEKLEGSFALFLLDRKSNKVLLARDPNGSKALYFSHSHDYFSFSSSIAQILNFPVVKNAIQINWNQVGTFLRYGSFAIQNDFYQNIKTFPAGHYALIDIHSNQFYIRAFGTSYLQAPILPTQLDENIAIQIERLTDGLLKQQVREIQTGLILDGSAGSVCLASIIQKNSSLKLRTYSLKGLSKNPFVNINPKANLFSQILKTKHTEIDLTQVDALKLLKDWTSFCALPSANTSGLIQYVLAKEIHQETQLIWNSLSADYIYYSHPTQQKMEYLWKLFPRIPKFMLPSAYKWYKLDPSLKLENKESQNEAALFLGLNEIFSPKEIDELLLPLKSSKNSMETIQNADGNQNWNFDLNLDWNPQNHLNNLIQRFIAKNQAEVTELPYLQFGMENRNAYILNNLLQPILNSGLSSFKLRGKTFMEAMAQKQLGERQKYNHYTNTSHLLLIKWLKSHWSTLIDQYFDAKVIQKEGVFNIRVIEKIRKQFEINSNYRNAQRLWLILQLQIWLHKWTKTEENPKN